MRSTRSFRLAKATGTYSNYTATMAAGDEGIRSTAVRFISDGVCASRSTVHPSFLHPRVRTRCFVWRTTGCEAIVDLTTSARPLCIILKVETIVDTVVATPAAVGDGLGKAKEAASSASELLESIPRTVQEIPIEVRVRPPPGPSMLSLLSFPSWLCCVVSGFGGGFSGITGDEIVPRRVPGLHSKHAKWYDESHECFFFFRRAVQ